MWRLAMQQHSSLGLMAITVERGWNSWIWYLSTSSCPKPGSPERGFQPISMLSGGWGDIYAWLLRLQHFIVNAPHSPSGQMPPHFLHPSVGCQCWMTPPNCPINLLSQSTRVHKAGANCSLSVLCLYVISTAPWRSPCTRLTSTHSGPSSAPGWIKIKMH